MRLRFTSLKYCLGFIGLCIGVSLQTVFAHGGGNTDLDTCFVEVGLYHMNFSAYQPEHDKKERFCSTLPEIGPTIISLDFVQTVLRKKRIGVQILEINPSSGTETVESENIIVNLPLKFYPKGYIPISHGFKKKGHYTALVTIEEKDGVRHTEQFSFAVAVPSRFLELYLLGVIATMIGTGYFFVNVWGKERPKVQIA